MSTQPTRLPDPVKIGMVLSFSVSLNEGSTINDFDVGQLSCSFRHQNMDKVGSGTITKTSPGVFQVAFSTVGLKAGDVFFDVRFNITPLFITPTMVCELLKAETTQ